jgi:hypothetical protein
VPSQPQDYKHHQTAPQNEQRPDDVHAAATIAAKRGILKLCFIPLWRVIFVKSLDAVYRQKNSSSEQKFELSAPPHLSAESNHHRPISSFIATPPCLIPTTRPLPLLAS